MVIDFVCCTVAGRFQRTTEMTGARVDVVEIVLLSCWHWRELASLSDPAATEAAQ